MSHVEYNSGKIEWYTPPFILEFAKQILNGPFDLDPASSIIANQIVSASAFFTKEDDGLTKPWIANRLWLNPPYSRLYLSEFINKLLYELEIGNTKSAALLINNCTETYAGQKALSKAKHILFLNKRISFLDQNLKPNNKPLQGQMLLFFGDYPEIPKHITDELGILLVNPDR